MAIYYFSTSLGDDSRTSAQAQNQATPWKTVSKLNSFFSSLNAGDSALFKRGETYPGAITMSKSGSSGNPITIGAWGSGEKPIISGFTRINNANFTTTSFSGVYKVSVGSLSTCNAVLMDGVSQIMGKLPRGNTGYYNITSSSGSNPNWTIVGSNSFTGNLNFSTSGAPNITAAGGIQAGEVVYRPRHWVLWRSRVTAQTSNSVSITADQTSPFNGSSTYSPTLESANFGFFLQNHPSLCTQLGDWSYDSAAHVLYMFFGASGPGSHTIDVATTANIVAGSGTNFIKFDNLDMRGGETAIINLSGCTDITVNQCNLFSSGYYGIFANGTSPRLTVTGSTISYIANDGIRASSGSSAFTITGNTFDHIGSVAGQGASGEGAYFGLIDIKGGSTFQNNIVTNIGYIGVSFQGSNNLIKNNYFDTVCMVKDDGGAIYTGGNVVNGSVVDGNIILNSVGCTNGTPHSTDPRAHGIYGDDGGSGMEVKNNTCAFCGNAGINFHSYFNVNVHNNTCFDNHISSIKYYNGPPSTDLMGTITFNNNLMFSKTTSELALVASGGSTNESTWFTAADNNIWTRPLSEGSIFSTLGGSKTLAQWKTYIGKETNSKAAPITLTDVNKIRFEYNNTSSPKVVSLGGTYIDCFNVSYAGSITLQPYTSAVLLQISASTSSTTTAAPTTTTTTTTHAPTTTTSTSSTSSTSTSSTSTTSTTTQAPTTTTTSSTTTTTTLALIDLPFPVVSGNFVESPTHTWGTGYGYGITNKQLTGNGFIQADYTGTSTQIAIIALDTVNDLEDYTGFNYAVYAESNAQYMTIANNVFTLSSVAVAVGDKFRLIRTGTTVAAEVSRDNGQHWTNIRTFPITTSATLFAKASIPITMKSLVNPKGYQVTNAPTTTTTTSSTTTTTTHATTTTTTTSTSTTTTTTAAPTTTTTTTSTSTTSTTTAAPTTTTSTSSTSTTSTTSTTSSSTTTTTTLALVPLHFVQSSGSFSESPSGTWGSGYGYAITDQKLTGSGFIQAEFEGTSNTTAILGLDVSQTISDYTGFDYAIYVADGSNVYTLIENNTFTNGIVVAQAGDLYRISRTGSTVRAEYSRDNGQHWTVLRTFPIATAAVLYAKASIPMTSRFLLNPKGYQLTTFTTTTTSTSTTTTHAPATTTTSTTQTTSIAPLVIKLVKKTNVTCRGGSNGMIQVQASGGSGGYLYRLNSNSFQASGTFTGLAPGRYTVTAKDSGNRLVSLTVKVYNGFFPC